MNLKDLSNSKTPFRMPDISEFGQLALPPLPERFLNTPWPDMPEKMLVTIDGWNDTPKTLVGEFRPCPITFRGSPYVQFIPTPH